MEAIIPEPPSLGKKSEGNSDLTPDVGDMAGINSGKRVSLPDPRWPYLNRWLTRVSDASPSTTNSERFIAANGDSSDLCPPASSDLPSPASNPTFDGDYQDSPYKGRRSFKSTPPPSRLDKAAKVDVDSAVSAAKSTALSPTVDPMETPADVLESVQVGLRSLEEEVPPLKSNPPMGTVASQGAWKKPLTGSKVANSESQVGEEAAIVVVTPQGAWKKPLNFSSFQQEVRVPVNSIWHALSTGKSIRNKPFQVSSNADHCTAKGNPPEEKVIKTCSKEYPWAARMDQSLRNLHRVTMPDYLDDGTPLVSIPSHVLLEGPENQKEFVLGQFSRCVAPSGGLVHAVVNKIWGRKCHIFTRKTGESSYLFHIPDESTRKWILQRGLWHVDDCLMFVSAWSHAANLAIPEIKTMPTWLSLKNIPSQLYSIKGIKWIASGIGEPMLTSRPWLDPTQIGEAKILVEVKLDKPFPQKVALKDDCGTITMVDVVYSWLPSKCGNCGQLGHKSSRCLGLRFEKSKESSRPMSQPVINTQLMESGPDLNALPHSDSPLAPENTTSASITPAKVANPSSIPSTEETSLPYASSTSIIVTPATTPVGTNMASTEETSPSQQLSGSAVHSEPCTRRTLSSATLRNKESTILRAASPSTVTTNNFAQEKATFQLEGERLIEPDLGSNKFASLVSPEVEEYSSESDKESDQADFMTPAGKRILRDRPVKPTTKAKEMHWQSSTRGRGHRGRGRGGRG